MSERLERIEKIRQFQRKLYLKAKQEKDFRFYILYDKISRWDILVWAWIRVKENAGSPGIDGQTFKQIEEKGVEDFLKTIQKDILAKSYQASPVLRCYIEKDNGKLRPLGIPTIKDRIVQMACKIVIEPIFEADFESCSYGFRPKKKAQDAINAVKSHLKSGCNEVLDADLSQYFDTIPHGKLLEMVEARISDKDILNLIRMWLKAPVVEQMRKGKTRYISGKKNNRGTPQGGVISPLLANIYLNKLDKEFFNKDGALFRCGARIVRYADDFVVLAKFIGEPIIKSVQGKLSELELELNESKSKVVKLAESSFDFLGFTFRYDKHLDGSRGMYLNIEPSKKSYSKLKDKIRKILHPGNKKPAHKLILELNKVLIGWKNYYNASGTYPRRIFRHANWYIMDKVSRFYKRKSQRRSKLYGHRAYEFLTKSGLVTL